MFERGSFSSNRSFLFRNNRKRTFLKASWFTTVLNSPIASSIQYLPPPVLLQLLVVFHRHRHEDHGGDIVAEQTPFLPPGSLAAHVVDPAPLSAHDVLLLCGISRADALRHDVFLTAEERKEFSDGDTILFLTAEALRNLAHRIKFRGPVKRVLNYIKHKRSIEKKNIDYDFTEEDYTRCCCCREEMVSVPLSKNIKPTPSATKDKSIPPPPATTINGGGRE